MGNITMKSAFGTNRYFVEDILNSFTSSNLTFSNRFTWDKGKLWLGADEQTESKLKKRDRCNLQYEISNKFVVSWEHP